MTDTPVPSWEQHRSRAYTHEDNNLSPFDPFESDVARFIVLKQLGYPVDYEVVPASAAFIFTIPDSAPDPGTYGEWTLKNNPQWFRGIISNRDFADLITEDDLEYPGETIKHIDPKFAFDIRRLHPVRLIDAVAFGWTREVRGAMNTVAGYEQFANRQEDTPEPIVSDVNPEVHMTLDYNVYYRLFMATYKRHLDLQAKGYPFNERDMLSNVDVMLNEWCENHGYTAATAEEVGGIVMDYYRIVEGLNPDFVKFKNTE